MRARLRPIDPLSPIKNLIWLYFWLLIVEGIFRKWVFPDFSNYIFVARDPVALMIYFMTWQRGHFPWRPALVILWVFAAVSVAFSFAGKSPFIVTLFGLRTNYLHPPLIFVMGAVLRRDDVIRIGRWFLILCIPIVILMWFQFEAPSESFINIGVANQEGGQMLGALGHIRAPGPFSFVTGVAAYFGYAAAFAIYGWREKGVYGTVLLAVATFCITAAVPLSISRTLMFDLLVVAMFGLAASVRDRRGFAAYVGPLVAALSLIGLAADTAYVEAFRTRWDMAANAGGDGVQVNVVGRILDDYLLPFQVAQITPLMGHGIGLGTMAGAQLASGQKLFLLAESELGRIVMELGPILGFAFIAWRFWLALSMVWRSWAFLHSRGDVLSWLLSGACFLAILSGQWGPSTQLGFAVFGAGLAMAAFNEPDSEDDEDTEDTEQEETELVEQNPTG